MLNLVSKSPERQDCSDVSVICPRMKYHVADAVTGEHIATIRLDLPESSQSAASAQLTAEEVEC